MGKWKRKKKVVVAIGSSKDKGVSPTKEVAGAAARGAADEEPLQRLDDAPSGVAAAAESSSASTPALHPAAPVSTPGVKAQPHANTLNAFGVWDAGGYDIYAVAEKDDAPRLDCAGQQVTLVGFVDRKDLNGRNGIIRFYMPKPQRRFAVEVEDETELMSLRPANLQARLAETAQTWHGVQVDSVRRVVTADGAVEYRRIDDGCRFTEVWFDNWSRSLYSVLRQIHPSVELHASAMQVLMDLLDFCVLRIAQHVACALPRTSIFLEKDGKEFKAANEEHQILAHRLMPRDEFLIAVGDMAARVRIAGASRNFINGLYEKTGDEHNGRPVYCKMNDNEVSLWMNAKGNWMAGFLADMHADRGYLVSIPWNPSRRDNAASPSLVSGVWKVLHVRGQTSEWREEEAVRVTAVMKRPPTWELRADCLQNGIDLAAFEAESAADQDAVYQKFVKQTGHPWPKATLDDADIESAVRQMLSGEPLKQAIAKGVKALDTFRSNSTVSDDASDDASDGAEGGSDGAEGGSDGASDDASDVDDDDFNENLILAQQAGLQLSPELVGGKLDSLCGDWAVSRRAAVYLAAVLEYLAAQVLELAGNAAVDLGTRTVIPRHIQLALRGDEELAKLVKGCVILWGGAVADASEEIGSKAMMYAFESIQGTCCIGDAFQLVSGALLTPAEKGYPSIQRGAPASCSLAGAQDVSRCQMNRASQDGQNKFIEEHLQCLDDHSLRRLMARAGVLGCDLRVFDVLRCTTRVMLEDLISKIVPRVRQSQIIRVEPGDVLQAASQDGLALLGCGLLWDSLAGSCAVSDWEVEVKSLRSEEEQTDSDEELGADWENEVLMESEGEMHISVPRREQEKIASGINEEDETDGESEQAREDCCEGIWNLMGEHLSTKFKEVMRIVATEKTDVTPVFAFEPFCHLVSMIASKFRSGMASATNVFVQIYYLLEDDLLELLRRGKRLNRAGLFLDPEDLYLALSMSGTSNREHIGLLSRVQSELMKVQETATIVEDAVLKNAQLQTRAAHSSLASLGEVYRLIQGHRESSKTAIDLERAVDAFTELVRILRHESNPSPADVFERISTAVDSAEEKVSSQRNDMRKIQSEVHRNVMAFAENLHEVRIQSLEEVDDSIKNVLTERDSLRARHVIDVEMEIQTLLQVVSEIFSHVSTSLDKKQKPNKGRHNPHQSCRLPELKSSSDLQSYLRSMQERESRLTSALSKALKCAQAHNKSIKTTELSSPVPTCAFKSSVQFVTFCKEMRPKIIKERPTLSCGEVGKALGAEWDKLSVSSTKDSVISGGASQMEDDEKEGVRCAMGSCVPGFAASPGCTWPDSTRLIRNVLAILDEWRAEFLGSMLAENSDAAMQELKAHLTTGTAVGALLGIKQDEVQEQTTTDRVFQAAGDALARERAHQLKDALGYFPSTAILCAGRRLLTAWKDEFVLVSRVLGVLRILEEHLRLNKQCLDGEVQLSSRHDHVDLELEVVKKEDLIQSISTARKEHKKATSELNTLAAIMAGGDDHVTQSVAQALGFQQPPTIEILRQNVRAARERLTVATSSLSVEVRQVFPEVCLFIGQGLPPELASLWQPNQSLDFFDEQMKVETPSRHTVFRVRSGKKWFAVKRYEVNGSQDLRTCLHEAAIIYRQRHHAIVEITALFQGIDGHSGGHSNYFYLQMPWYEHGSLESWVKSEEKPTWKKVRGVIMDSLNGLAHLHENKIIHSDVKPANILVDSRERGRLADFDISLDTTERTKASNVTRMMSRSSMCATFLGGTLDFVAPEVMETKQATRRTDMYSFGKTVDIVNRYCNPDDDVPCFKMARDQTEEFVNALTSKDPKARPSAVEAISMPFFASKTIIRRSCEATMCENCAEGEIPVERGLECGCGHFVCSSCASQHVRRSSMDPGYDRDQRDGKVMCPFFPRECRAAAYADKALAQALSSRDFMAYQEGRLAIFKARLERESDEKRKKEVEEKVARLMAENEHKRTVYFARKHIESGGLGFSVVDETPLPHCPRCKTAFYDFSGCFAVSCHTCACHFCGWCLADCGNSSQDAHRHVASCRAKPAGADSYFGRIEQFQAAHQERCRQRVTEYLQSLEAGVRADVQQEMAQTLRALGVAL